MKKELESSPIYNISMASIELFHSNFWYWCFIKYEESLKYFAKGTKLEKYLAKNKKPDIYKESKNKNDLRLEVKNGDIFIIENKIKSIPDEEQLIKYKSNVEKRFFGGIITGLIEPDFDFKSIGYEYLSYKNIAENLSLFIEKEEVDSYSKLIIEDYCNVIKIISDEISKELEGNTQYSPDKKINLPDTFESIYKKLINAQLAEQIVRNEKHVSLLEKPYIKKGFNNKNNTLSIYVPFEENVEFGIQIEQYEYRKYVRINNHNEIVQKGRDKKAQEKKEKLAKKIFETKTPEKIKKYWVSSYTNRYVTADYVFLYFKEEPSISTNESYNVLTDRIIKDIEECFRIKNL